MLFNAKQFEQYLAPRQLKQGLALFEKGRVEPAGRQGPLEQRYLADGAELLLKKRGDKVLAYDCSCGRQLCEHLAAVLFFLQQDALHIAVKKTKRIAKKAKPAAEPNLQGFLSNWHQNNTQLFELCSTALQLLLKPFLAHEKLDQKQLDAIAQQIKTLPAQLHLQQPAKHFDWHLALLAQLPTVFNRRLVGHETALLELVQQSKAVLADSFEGSLTLAQKKSLRQAVLAVAATRNQVMQQVALFLLPHLLVLVKQAATIDELHKALHRRRAKLQQLTAIDQLVLLRLMVAARQAELTKTKATPPAQHVEWVMAQAELDLCRNKTEKAFKFLREQYATIKTYPGYVTPYLDYCIEKAHEQDETGQELFYLKARLVSGLHMLPAMLDRFFDLLLPTNMQQQVDELLQQLQAKPQPFITEKMIALLLKAKRLPELVTWLNLHEPGFAPMQRLMLKRLPLADEALLELYVKIFVKALGGASSGHERDRLIDSAGNYISQLPAVKRQQVATVILKRVEGDAVLHAAALKLQH